MIAASRALPPTAPNEVCSAFTTEASRRAVRADSCVSATESTGTEDSASPSSLDNFSTVLMDLNTLTSCVTFFVLLDGHTLRGERRHVRKVKCNVVLNQ